MRKLIILCLCWLFLPGIVGTVFGTSPSSNQPNDISYRAPSDINIKVVRHRGGGYHGGGYHHGGYHGGHHRFVGCVP